LFSSLNNTPKKSACKEFSVKKVTHSNFYPNIKKKLLLATGAPLGV
jgi:hypothetical protein